MLAGVGHVVLAEDLFEYWVTEQDEHRHLVYPEPGGLLRWADLGARHRFCWLTDGDPDSWPVVTWNIYGEYEIHPVNTVTFIHDWLSGRLSVTVLGDPDPLGPWFEPYRQRDHVVVSMADSDVPPGCCHS
jgi:hypothetical protein